MVSAIATSNREVLVSYPGPDIGPSQPTQTNDVSVCETAIRPLRSRHRYFRIH